jgi:hypothetical protein
MTIRFSLMASLGLFAAMLAIGAGLGIFTIQQRSQFTMLGRFGS